MILMELKQVATALMMEPNIKFAKVVADIKDGNKKLVEGTDYDLVYVDNVYGKNVNGAQKGAVLAIAKGTYGGSLDDDTNGVVKGVYTDANGDKIANVIAIKTFTIEQVKVNKSSITVKNATYAGVYHWNQKYLSLLMALLW